MTTKTWTDPIVDEIRRIREGIAKEADYDLHKLVAGLQEAQKRHGDKLISLPPKGTEKQMWYCGVNQDRFSSLKVQGVNLGASYIFRATGASLGLK